MYTQRIIHFPAAGKGPELRKAMEERNDSANAEPMRSPHSLSQRMFAPEPAFVTVIRHESLAALEAYQHRNATNATYLAQTQKIASLLSRPQPQELYERLLPRQGTGPVGYTLRVKYFPAAGKGPELRRLLEDRIRSPRPGTVGAELSAQVAPPDGAAFVILVLFSDLAGMDNW